MIYLEIRFIGISLLKWGVEEMKLSSNEAYRLLMEAKSISDGGYIEHSLRVGEAAARIAESLGLDSEKARALGYIHDIGKKYGQPFTQHVAKGYEFLIGLGYDEEYANICLTHSYLNNDIDCTAKGVINPDNYRYDFTKEFVKNHVYTIYEKIINLCDLMCTCEFLILEERLVEIMSRSGAYANTKYHLTEAVKLKHEIDELLGFNVYLLFPEIGERLFGSQMTLHMQQTVQK